MKPALRLLACCAIWLLATMLVASAASAAPPTIDFNRDIKPILSNRCFLCHGPDEAERKGGVRLDTAAGAVEDLGGYAAIVPGEPDNSALVKRIKSTNPDEQMPPPESGKKLSPREVELLSSWIRQGGNYASHWSYVKPVRPAAPAVKGQAWARGDLDRFILSRLEQEGLRPSPEADKATLARRVSLDLTGLPPTLAEVDALVSSSDPQAYEKFVDQLLAKTAYGEHWAHMWLDLARYADSAGYADDPPRTIWLYRDYVIRAFNQNKPFDTFTVEQIAGDLLPGAGDDQLIATAFHRNTLTNNEGGTNDEEFRNVAVVDRVNTTMAVWMGTTIACSQCHNHKYDPLSQEEFFKLFAFFNNTEDADKKDESPLLSRFTPEEEEQRRAWQAEIAKLEPQLKAETPELVAARDKWAAEFPHDLPWQSPKPTAKSRENVAIEIGDDAVIRVAAGAKNDAYTIELPLDITSLRAVRLEALTDDSLPGKGPGYAGGNFVVSKITAKLKSPVDTKEQDVTFKDAVADFTQSGLAPEHVLKNPNTRTSGWGIAGQTGQPHALVLATEKPVEVSPGATLIVTIEHSTQTPNQTLGRLRLSVTGDARALDLGRAPLPIIAALKKPAGDRTMAETQLIAEYYRSVAPLLEPVRKDLAAVRKKLDDLKPATVPIMKQLAEKQRRATKIQHRGNYLDQGKEVTEGTPAVFPSLPAGAAVDRLALARWLIDENNPLTARVIANRYWEQVFGIGIVSTSEEFGSQGDQPFHPELLDWLATELVRLKWDMKAFVRLLVTSAAYRQSSRVTPELQARDPDNRLLARGPRFRLSAEMVRDQALAVSGLLSHKMFGAPVKPMQPSIGLNAAFGGGIDWQTSTGDDRYRRGLYTTWRRSNPYPSMATFDAPNREVCTVRRVRTNTPLQALVTLNDPVYVEAAQALARRMVSEGGSTPADRVQYGFRLCLSRAPSTEEQSRLVALYESALARLRDKPADAAKLASEPLGPPPAGQPTPELAALTVVGNVLLNLDEALMKR